MDFEETTRPVKQRENAFREGVKIVAATPGKVLSYTIKKADRGENDSQFAADGRKMAEAANELEKPVTVKKEKEVLPNGDLKVYFFTNGKKITKPKKATPTPASAPAKK